MCAGSFVRRGCELINYGNCLSLRGGLIIRKRAIGVAILANVLGTVRTKSVGAHLKANLSATRAVRFARLDEVDRDWRGRLPGPPFRAAQSSHNGIVQLGRPLAEGHLPVLLVEGGDATQLWLRRGALLFPSEQIGPHLRTPAHLGPRGILLESVGHPACWRHRGKFVR